MFYDGLSRLLAADYSVGADYGFGYDVAGNLVNNNGVTRTYNAANQMTNDGTNALTYDNNGNLTNDGVNSYTWDRANRMLTAPGSTSYKYDGVGNRIQQTVSSVVSNYLNDVQPGLTQLLAETVSGNTTRYVQGVRGIHAMESNSGVWSYFAQDGLGSVRGVFDNASAVVSSQSYNPIGVPATDYGKGFGFTGEYTDTNDLLYLRARYYAPSKGVFTALDPFEGFDDRPMSLNGYSWVEGNVPNNAVGEPIFHNRYSYANGNPVNNTDPSGLCAQPTQWWNPVDANCYYSAVGLAERFSQGNPQEYDIWFKILIEKNWEELKAIELLGSFAAVTGASRQFLDNAAIIPMLFRENPQAALQALEQFACQNSGTLQGFASTAIIASARVATSSGAAAGGSTGGFGGGSAGTIGVAVVAGIALAIGGLIAWGELTRPSDSTSERADATVIPIPQVTINPPTETQQPCGFEQCSDLESRIEEENVYRSAQGALNAIKTASGNNSLALQDRKGRLLGSSGPVCPGVGTHYRTRPFEGSIVCCPCCAGTTEAVRCFIVF